MSNNQDSIYETLKLLGYKLESELNEAIKELINNEAFIKVAATSLKKHSNILKLLRENQELLFAPLNIPTKNDIANVSKLVIQNEEKLDMLDDRLVDVEALMKDINKRLRTVGSSEETKETDEKKNTGNLHEVIQEATNESLVSQTSEGENEHRIKKLEKEVVKLRKLLKIQSLLSNPLGKRRNHLG